MKLAAAAAAEASKHFRLIKLYPIEGNDFKRIRNTMFPIKFTGFSIETKSEGKKKREVDPSNDMLIGNFCLKAEAANKHYYLFSLLLSNKTATLHESIR